MRKLTKLWVILGVLGIASMVGFGTIWSYARTAKHELGESMRDAVPIGFELKRLEVMTQELIPEIQSNQKVAAQLDVEVEYLEREIDSIKIAQTEARAEMGKLREALNSGKDELEFGGQSWTRRQVEDDLDRRLAKFDDAKSRLNAKLRILESRRQTLRAATARIQQARHQHDLLIEKAAGLESELKTLELAQDAGNFEFDPSKLKETKDLAMQVEKRIRTLHKLVEGQQPALNEIPVEVDTRNVAQKFDEYFAK